MLPKSMKCVSRRRAKSCSTAEAVWTTRKKGFYSGCLFKVTGENIKTVSATIDNGAIYRTKTVKDTSDDRDEWVRTMYQGTNPAIDGVDKSMSDSTVYVTAKTEQGGDVQYKVSLVRDMIGWKVSSVELYFPSQN